MQTYSHAAIGAALGALVFPDNASAQATCIAASVAVDFPMAYQYAQDNFHSRQPLMHPSCGVLEVNEASHSLPLWLLLGLCSLFLPDMFKWTAIGGMAHVIIDVLTHGKGKREQRPFWLTDVTFMWPLPLDLRLLGVWEYRYGHGILRPKPLELLVLLISAATTLCLWFQ